MTETNCYTNASTANCGPSVNLNTKPNSTSSTQASANLWSNPIKLLSFFNQIEQLKKIKRTGWIENHVQNPESIADHMHRMGIMAMMIEDHTIDRDRCIKIAIVHDLAEAIVGDIAPSAGISKEEKQQLEMDAMHTFINNLENSLPIQNIFQLWKEYEDNITPEARLVKDLDKFEMLVQAFEYEKADDKLNLQDFFDTTQSKVIHPQVQCWLTELLIQRDVFLKSKDEEGMQ
ncbi:hypothetical protein CONCODRAFT_80447 [Conidiobolus coronatus NRRL 28638]|uniref:5'-deoxynucleotidase n=1 Tax=Conidiobolus coronatus (strain ATCC 28846 / CBS 209.66 / NRRL 28638) TaxID=796925 RepID=A0A137NV80_CONC2|nr:hypothetical protein CONCODRAFT_80447 [Conidiobolus coronatus NRRL 28638]|eukprot:KXN66598.1 hypothetical protein CONCODRAFT_80447 [Conidiobolus coronatus NRRL 28638]